MKRTISPKVGVKRLVLRRIVLCAGAAFALVLIGLDGVRLATRREAVELQDENRLPRKFARALYFHNVAFDIVSGRNRNIALVRKR